MSIGIFLPLLILSIGVGLACEALPKKPKGDGPHIEFGRWVREQRERLKARSQLSSEKRAKELGLNVINQGKLSHLERGWNGNPEPDLLRELATFIRLPYAVIVEKWVKHRFGVAMADIEESIVQKANQFDGLDPVDLVIARRYHETNDARLRQVVERALDVTPDQEGVVLHRNIAAQRFPSRKPRRSR
jgi:hypothetical protein